MKERETIINKINLIKCVYQNMFIIIDDLKESELKSKLINIYDFAILPLYELLEKEAQTQIKAIDKQQIKDLVYINDKTKTLISLKEDLKELEIIKK